MIPLVNPYEIAPFLSPRAQTPQYIPPPKPHDMSVLMEGLGSVGDAFGLMSQLQNRSDNTDKEIAQKEKARLQQAALEGSQQSITMRGQDMMDKYHQDSNDRLDRDKAEQFIRQALTSGDASDVHALDLAVKGLGWTREEGPSRYAAPAPSDAPAASTDGATPPPAGKAGPSSFDAAFNAATQKESGGNPRAVNPTSGALGTYQLMPDQLPQGVSKEQYLAMTPEQQKKDYAERYLPNHGLSKDTLAPQDVGLSIGAPAAIGKPDSFVVYPKGSDAVRQNPSWDRNKDGQVDAGELRANYGAPPQQTLTLPDQQIGRPMPGPIDANAPYNVGTDPGKAAPPGTPPKFLSDFMSSSYGVDPLPQQQLGNGQGAPGQGGGRHTFRDKDGNVVADIDLPQIRAQHQQSLEAALTPILAGAKTDPEKQLAQQALGFATHAVESGQYSWKDAANEAIKFYQTGVGEAGKTSRAGIAGGFQQIKASNQQADHIIGQVARDAKLPAMNDAEGDLQGTINALGTNSGTGDVIAIRKLLHSIEGRPTDADYNSMVNSSGFLTKFLNLPDQVLEGRLTPEVVEQVKQNVQMALKTISDRKQAAAQQAAHAMEQAIPYGDDTTQRQLSQRVYDYFYGSKGAPAQSSAAGPSNDDVLKALGQ